MVFLAIDSSLVYQNSSTLVQKMIVQKPFFKFCVQVSCAACAFCREMQIFEFVALTSAGFICMIELERGCKDLSHGARIKRPHCCLLTQSCCLVLTADPGSVPATGCDTRRTRFTADPGSVPAVITCFTADACSVPAVSTCFTADACSVPA